VIVCGLVCGLVWVFFFVGQGALGEVATTRRKRMVCWVVGREETRNLGGAIVWLVQWGVVANTEYRKYKTPEGIAVGKKFRKLQIGFS